MAFWAVNSRIYDASASTLQITQRRRPSIRQGDRILLFSHRREEVRFFAECVVEAATATETDGDQVVFDAHLGPAGELEPERRLSDFTYSLLKVFRYADPSRHFNHSYARLGVDDYTTLREANIFWARTAFGTYLNALPEVVLPEFVRLVVDVQPGLLVSGAQYSHLWKHLRGFIVRQYLGAYDLMQAIAKTTESLDVSGDDFSYGQIGLRDDDSASTDLIEVQERRLAEFVAPSQNTGKKTEKLFDTLDDRISTNEQSEAEFEKLFKGTRWPTQTIQI
jgi:hypothetical protein